MPDYSESKIYKITANNGKLIYIGSTTSSLKIRFTAHKSKAKLIKQNRPYRISNYSSMPLFDYEDVDIHLIENYPCKTKQELQQREGYWIDIVNCVNIQKPLKFNETDNQRRRNVYKNDADLRKRKKEYFLKNREKYREYAKQYYQANKQKLLESFKLYREQQKQKQK